MGLPRSTYVTIDGLGSAYSPEVLCLRVAIKESNIQPLTFWFKLVSIFSLLVVTMFISSLHMLTIPPSLASKPR